ncbi:MAG: hypothetical protein DRR19_17935 [Candidatus Parabeggiatoa sp. nov. 1]|nr:MAG: hypothetical protein DRR19_17935 [Gammaproteobacteria bacterium]
MNRFYLFSILFTYLLLGNFSIVQSQPLTKAEQAFQHGYHEQAIVQWQAALATTQNPSHRLEAQLGIVRAYRHIGAYDKALNTLNTALPIAQKADDTTYYVLLLNELSKLRLSQGIK